MTWIRWNCLLLALVTAPVLADDWPQWMGPQRDGVWRETGIIEAFPAGGPDVHPHAASPEADRLRWDKDVARFNEDVQLVGRFFDDVLTGRLATPQEIREQAASFFGIQGPWYTVGWKMAVIIERRFGRPELIQCMSDPYRLLERYNTAASELNARGGGGKLATWPQSLLEALKGSVKRTGSKNVGDTADVRRVL